MEGSLTKAPVLQLHFMDSDGFGAPTFWGGRDQVYTTHGPDINCVDGPRVLGAAAREPKGGDGSRIRPAPESSGTTLLVPTQPPWQQVISGYEHPTQGYEPCRGKMFAELKACVVRRSRARAEGGRRFEDTSST